MLDIYRSSCIAMPDNFSDQKLHPEIGYPEKNLNTWSVLLNSKIFMQYHSKIVLVIHIKDYLLK